MIELFLIIACVLDSLRYLWAVVIAMILFVCNIILTKKDYERRDISFLKEHLKKIGIDYSLFQSLSRKEQIELLKKTHNIDEEELNIDFYNLILNKK